MPSRKYNKTVKKNRTKARKKFGKIRKTYKKGGFIKKIISYVNNLKDVRRAKKEEEMENEIIELYYLLQFKNGKINKKKLDELTNGFYKDEVEYGPDSLINKYLIDAKLLRRNNDDQEISDEEVNKNVANLEKEYLGIMERRKPASSSPTDSNNTRVTRPAESVQS